MAASYLEEKSNLKYRKKYLIINLLLLALLFGSVSFNKEYLRPLFRNVPFIGILLGCFPNFIAAYVVSLFPIGGALARKLSKGRAIIYSSAGLVFILLAAEELRPFFNASKVFDFWDIVASGVGALMAVLTFELVVFWRKK
ncbi:MAG: hypothetical protein GXO74_14110 [Calditrichaeota bacterium]|nr:hypothetical protein [Calditrichota bacterium]